MLVRKTVKVPIHYATTKNKLHILNKLAAQLSYGVKLWSEVIEQHRICTRQELQQLKYQHFVRDQTKLSACFVQQCGNQALWMWKSYQKLRQQWERMVERARKKRKKKWLRKLLKREPSKPFHIKNTVGKKIPIRFDCRTGEVQRSERAKLSPWLIRISTLKKYEKLTVFLNPSSYHLRLLEQEIRDFQLVKHGKKYYVYIIVQYEVKDQPIRAVRGVDLGIRWSAATVLLHPGRPLRSENFSIIRDGLKQQRLNRMNKRITELQQDKKWMVLKKTRRKQRRVAEYYDRLTAKVIAEISNECLVAIGHPKWIKYKNYRGNGKRRLRRLMTRWTYGRIIRYVREKCAEQGIKTVRTNEWLSSMTCHRCGSRNTERSTQSVIYCRNCELTYNADFNAAINIGSSILAKPRSRGVQLNHPKLWMSLPKRWVNAEAMGL